MMNSNKMKTGLVAAGLIFCSNLMAQTPTVSGDNMLCPDGTGTVTTQTFDTYQWLIKYYGSSVTNPIPGETNQTLIMDYYNYAASYVSVATTLGGVADTSAEFFVDGWVFGSPYVISSGDYTIGMSGESVLCPGATMYFEFSNPYTTNITWYKDGVPIPGETSQTLVVTQPGTYYVEGAPFECPDFLQGPGVALDVDVLDFAPLAVTTTGDFTVGTGGEAVLCPEDTLYFNLQNPYDTDIVWYQNGTPVSGANTQTLMVTEAGTYNVEGAPADCPLYTQTLAVALDVEVLTFPAPVVSVSGDYTMGTNGEYIICETTDEVIIDLDNPYNTSITWYNNTSLLTGETQQTLTVTDPGLYIVQAAPAECPDYIQELADTVVVESCGLGLNDEEAVLVSIYPNPASTYMVISIPAEQTGLNFELQDQAGRVVAKGQLQNTLTTIETADLASGIYVLRVDGISSQLVTVQNN